MSFICAVNLVVRLLKIYAVILTYFKEILGNMTAKGIVQRNGIGF